MKFNARSRRFAWVGGTLATLGLGFILATSFGSAPTPVSELPAGTAAMRVAIDPETGVLGPDNNPAKALDSEMQNMLSRSSAGLEEIVHPDGHVSVHLQGRFMSASVARIDENGKLKTTCVESNTAMEDFLNGENSDCSDHEHTQAEVK